jgi:hypothetical protein
MRNVRETAPRQREEENLVNVKEQRRHRRYAIKMRLSANLGSAQITFDNTSDEQHFA